MISSEIGIIMGVLEAIVTARVIANSNYLRKPFQYYFTYESHLNIIFVDDHLFQILSK